MMIKRTISILMILNNFTYAQTLDQINQAKKIIKQTGMSENDVRAIAKQKGFSNQQIEGAIKKVRESENNTSTLDLNNQNQNKFITDQNITNNTLEEQFLSGKDLNQNDELDQSEDEQETNITTENQDGYISLTYFGYDIFKRDPELFQSTTVGVVDPDYLIGPGDEIIMMLWGETQFRQLLSVDREGFIFIPELGQVFVNGLNLNLLESKLFRVLSKSYSSLNPINGKATTFLDVSLGNLRPLRIQVIGEVSQPGAYTVSPSTSLFSALYYFNGPTQFGSLRDIRLIRAGEEIASIDFYDYLLTGKKPKDVKLQLDDVIYIPSRMKTVSIQGSIRRPGIYELKDSETFKNLIEIAGGLNVTAYLKRAQIDRVVPFDKRLELNMDRVYNDVALSQILESEDLYELYDGDRIKIFSIFDSRQNVVTISGAVGRPGNYDISKNLRLSDLINKADGLLGDAYMDRVDIIRTRTDLKEELIRLDLSKAMNENIAHNIELNSLDRVTVYSTNQMTSERTVSIFGLVRDQGQYSLQENMTLYDLIFRSGGYVDEEYKKQVYLKRADLIRYNDDGITQKIISFNLGHLLDNAGGKENLILQNRDVVRIYPLEYFESAKRVSIAGSIRRPGGYNYKTNMSLKDLILEAGGINSDIYKYNVEIARIDPNQKQKDTFAESILSIDILNNYLNDEELALELRPYDYISIRPDPYFGMQKIITIKGLVYYPGDYAILNSKEKISSIIKRAGGLKPDAYPLGSLFIRKDISLNIDLRKIIANPNSKYDIIVQDGDVLIINEKPNMIQVLGEVSSPGFYKFTKGMRTKSAIRNAGGFSQNAEINDIFVRYLDGRSKKYTRWNNPKITDGSVIIVGAKKEEEPFDRTEYASRLTSIIANLAQAVSLIIISKG